MASRIKKLARQKTHEVSCTNMQRHKGALARSKSIDQQLDEDREKRQREIQLLILGGASSGKSTFIKQLRLHQGDGFPEDERASMRLHVFENLMDAIYTITEQMDRLCIPYDNEDNKKCAAEFRLKFPKCNHYYVASMSPVAAAAAACDTPPIPASPAHRDRGPPPDYSQVQGYMTRIVTLWKDTGIQKCFGQRDHFRLVPAEKYFLENLGRISGAKYIPSIQDVLYIRKPTLGVQEHAFQSDGLHYRVIDVAGQKNQRKKWIHFFDGVTAVIFFAALSGFCENLEEEKTLNSLEDSLHTFDEVLHNEFLERTDFILFLNKRDVFEEKMKIHNLKECFPDYTGGNTVDAGLKFIRDQFMKKKPENKHVYPHISCAVDVNMMKKMIADVMQIIIEINLRKATPL